MSNGDTFSDILWPVYTEDDYKLIDQICEESVEVTDDDNGAPRVFIEIDPPTDTYEAGKAHKELKKSPFELFRKKNYLSVSDICAPAWCELQFDYGLRQSRHRPLKQRPASFVSDKGKEIRVNVPVAVKREKVTHEGKKTHKVLEREIHKEEVVVEVKTIEEMWALRLLDLLCRLRVLKDLGVCREVPVWGVLHDHAFLGVIDELCLSNGSSSAHARTSPRSSPRRKKKLEDSQATLDAFISPGKKAKPLDTEPLNLRTVQISDSKTRKSNTVPTHADTLPARLQLMLYWRLLHEALTLNEVKAGSFFARLKLDPERKFSEIFKKEVAALALEHDLSLKFLDTTCLKDSIEPYAETIKGLQISSKVSTTLKLVYRRRGNPTKRLKVEETVNAINDTAQTNLLQVQQKLSEDITSTRPNSIGPSNNTPGTTDGSSTSMQATSKVVTGSGKSKKRKRRRESSTSRSDKVSEKSTSDSDSISDDNRPETLSPRIIGTKKFQYKPELLDRHLESVLLWWHGKRAPKGVELEDSRRCFTCEYRDGCEWREEKAMELLTLAKQKATSVKSEIALADDQEP